MFSKNKRLVYVAFFAFILGAILGKIGMLKETHMGNTPQYSLSDSELQEMKESCMDKKEFKGITVSVTRQDGRTVVTYESVCVSGLGLVIKK